MGLIFSGAGLTFFISAILIWLVMRKLIIPYFVRNYGSAKRLQKRTDAEIRAIDKATKIRERKKK